MKLDKICEFCGDEFVAGRTNQRFCSRDCAVSADRLRKRWDRKIGKVDFPPQMCIVCGKEFQPRRRNQLTCGGDCAEQHRLNTTWDRIIDQRNLKPKKVLEVRKCVSCGKEFNPNTYRQILCGNPECKKLRNRETTSKRPKQKKKKYVPAKKTGPTLAEMQRKAEEQNTTYGELCKPEVKVIFPSWVVKREASNG